MSATPRRVILDCDPGHDDALAILLAAASPHIRLEAITTVAGNQTLAKTTLNARRVCTVAGIANVPIAAGCDRPLVREPIIAAEIHGVSGLDGPQWADPTVALDPRHAVDLLLEAAAATAASGTDGMTIVAVGPLTNVASALQRDAGFGDGVERLVIMGGAIGLGNWTPAAEFNIHADPEAADVVFRSGIPITLAPLEVTHLALATDAVLARIDALDTPVGRMSGALLRYFANTYERVFGFEAPAVHDPCAVAALIDPAVMPTRHLNVAVETGSELCDGRTVIDVYGTTGRAPNADVGVDFDVGRFWELMIGALRSYGGDG